MDTAKIPLLIHKKERCLDVDECQRTVTFFTLQQICCGCISIWVCCRLFNSDFSQQLFFSLTDSYIIEGSSGWIQPKFQNQPKLLFCGEDRCVKIS
jgi:hypothetical protein